jgi:hypothetical protein
MKPWPDHALQRTAAGRAARAARAACHSPFTRFSFPAARAAVAIESPRGLAV